MLLNKLFETSLQSQMSNNATFPLGIRLLCQGICSKLSDFSLGWIRGRVYKFLYTRIQGTRLEPGALSVFLMLLTPFTKTLRRSTAPSDGFGDKKNITSSFLSVQET